MIKDNKTRIMVTIPKSMEEKIESYCEMSGLSKSTFICMCVSERLMQYDAGERAAKEILTKYVSQADPLG